MCGTKPTALPPSSTGCHKCRGRSTHISQKWPVMGGHAFRCRQAIGETLVVRGRPHMCGASCVVFRLLFADGGVGRRRYRFSRGASAASCSRIGRHVSGFLLAWHGGAERMLCRMRTWAQQCSIKAQARTWPPMAGCVATGSRCQQDHVSRGAAVELMRPRAQVRLTCFLLGVIWKGTHSRRHLVHFFQNYLKCFFALSWDPVWPGPRLHPFKFRACCRRARARPSGAGRRSRWVCCV